MFLKDLEPYRYGLTAPLKDVVAVGWLSKISGYMQGAAPAGFSDTLAQLLSTHRVNQTRGYHVCEFCSRSPLTCDAPAAQKITLGSAELWVPSASDKQIIYASPDLVHHYVTEHHYLPPGDFIEAVMSARDTLDWDASSECERRLEATFRAESAQLREFGREIWIAEGPDVAVAGFHYPTRMAVIRLSDGGLFVWSPVRLTDRLRAEVDAIGPVRHIVAPNSLHHLFLPEWRRAYPGARLHAPPGLRKKRPDIAFDADLGDAPSPDWAGAIDQVLMQGNLITTEAVFFHVASGTVLFTDLLQHIPPNRLSGWRAVVAKLDLMVGPEPSVPRKFRLAFTGRRAARASLERVLAWPAEKVLMAHGTPVAQDARAYLRRAFGWLTV